MITIKNLYKSFKNEYLYEDFNISFESGKITSIIGASGTGKTTLLRIMAGIEPYEKGNIEGIDKERTGIVFQEDRLLPWLNVFENIALVLKDKRLKPFDVEKMINEVLYLLRLQDCANLMPDELSGGMKRRVAIGRALAYDLACDGQLVLLDEPFKGLDSKLKDEIVDECKCIWRKYKKTIILVTHDVEDAQKLSDCIYEFYGKPVKVKTNAVDDEVLK